MRFHGIPRLEAIMTIVHQRETMLCSDPRVGRVYFGRIHSPSGWLHIDPLRLCELHSHAGSAADRSLFQPTYILLICWSDVMGLILCLEL